MCCASVRIATEARSNWACQPYGRKRKSSSVTTRSTNLPIEVNQAFGRVCEEAMKSCTYFHTWWSLANVALPKYRSTMSDDAYVDFFHACSSGFLALTFVSLAKLLDRDPKALGLSQLRSMLTDHGFYEEAELIESGLKAHEKVASRILAIRNRTVSHNEHGVTRDEVFKRYGVTPDEIREFVEAVRIVLNEVGRRLGWPTEISAGQRQEQAAMALLRRLAGECEASE